MIMLCMLRYIMDKFLAGVQFKFAQVAQLRLVVGHGFADFKSLSADVKKFDINCMYIYAIFTYLDI